MRSNRWRVYLAPFDAAGVYTSYQEITDYVVTSSLGELAQNLDNTDYDIGIYRTSSIRLRLRNLDGLFSDVARSPTTLFKYKRTDSLIKITWDVQDVPLICGNFECGNAILFTETEMFVGLLDDSSTRMDVSGMSVDFEVLGREDLLRRVNFPSSVVATDLISVALFKAMNQAPITTLLTVSQSNIVCGSDVQIDSVTDLAKVTTQDAVNDLLLISNSVLYIQDGVIFVAPRTPTVDLQYTFHGQASTSGVENITDIQNISSGLSRVFNYLAWDNASPADPTVVEDAASVIKFGVLEKDFSLTFVTDTGNKSTLLGSILAEFKDPKQEMDLIAPLDTNTTAVNLLDRVVVDYPTVYVEQENVPLPICGVAICGTAVLPAAQWAFTMDSSAPMKVIGKTLDIPNGLYTFKLREI